MAIIKKTCKYNKTIRKLIPISYKKNIFFHSIHLLKNERKIAENNDRLDTFFLMLLKILILIQLLLLFFIYSF